MFTYHLKVNADDIQNFKNTYYQDRFQFTLVYSMSLPTPKEGGK